MIWNDFFDVEQDRRDRPFRPIPSERISRLAAGAMGVIALFMGVLLAWWAGCLERRWRDQTAIISIVLVVAILLYDGWLKRTRSGPVAMGACRSLNVLLGLSVADDTFPWIGRVYLALVVGLYIVGVTWFAQNGGVQVNRAR